MEGPGVGVLVLVRREFQVSRVVSIPGRPGAMDSVGMVLSTVRGRVAILCVYAPPSRVLEGDMNGPPCWIGCGRIL